MKKIAFLSALLFLQSPSFSAVTLNDIPNHFKVRQHWLSLTSTYDIEAKNQLIGTLYRKFFSLTYTYEFYDAFEVEQAIAKARFFSWTAHFDIYDTQDHLLGMAREKFFSFFGSFDILSPDNRLQATANLNLWGTQFTMIDPVTRETMAIMTRPFLRLKHDWNIKMVNRQLIEDRKIDPNVLLTVIAFQGDDEDWQNANRNRISAQLQQSNQFLNQIAGIAEEEGLAIINELPKDFPIENFANQLEQDFYQSQGEDFRLLSDKEQFSRFESHFSQLLKSDSLNQDEKQALLFLIQNRF
jgi:hypothetical protein